MRTSNSSSVAVGEAPAARPAGGLNKLHLDIRLPLVSDTYRTPPRSTDTFLRHNVYAV